MQTCLRTKLASRLRWASKRLQSDNVLARRQLQTARAVSLKEHAVYIEEIAVSQSPKRLGSLLKALEARGGTLLSPSDREGLHPLVIPLIAEGERVTCMLRWPQPSQFANMSLPVVSMQRGGLGLTLLARSVDEYLHRLLAEEDIAAGVKGGRPLAALAGPDGLSLYKSGDVEAAGFGDKLQVYLIRKAGMFPDVCESLSHNHLARGDKVSALVASEWYMRNGYFPGWARPYEFAGELLGGMNRLEEARDMARVALRLPWWSLQKGFEATVKLAQIPGTPAEVRYALSEEAAAAAQAKVSKMPQTQAPKSPQQAALDKASSLMDMVAAGAAPSYDSIRAELAQAYKEAGLSDVSNFIISAT